MKKGFTLAEVLITLAVIGVVATLTLPNVIGNHQNKVLMTQLQKTINTIQNAVMKYMEDTTAEEFDEHSVSGMLSAKETFLKNYFNTVNICDKQTGFDSCLAPTYTSFDKSQSVNMKQLLTSINESGGLGGYKCAVLTSGATVCIGGWTNADSDSTGLRGSGCRKFLIDVNGIKTPNVVGKDVFYLNVHASGKMLYNTRDNASYDGGHKVQEEARGDYCTTSEINPKKAACLPYIISHGWQFKF